MVINGRHYVDGVLLKTLHASTVLEQGADLCICVNPIVPVDTSNSVETGWMQRGKLIDRGMATILSQTFRTMIHSRMNLGLRDYDMRYPDQDVLLFEARRDDYRMFFTNIFRFSSRKAVCEHAFQSTLDDLRQRQDELRPILKKHGLRLRDDVINNPELDIWKTVGLPGESRRHPVSLQLSDALARLESMVRLKSYREKGSYDKSLPKGGLTIPHNDETLATEPDEIEEPMVVNG